LLAPAQRAFRAAGVAVDVLLTERPGHGAEAARSGIDRYRSVFTLGGDGTAMEVIEALSGTQCPVGILPGGTGNLLAFALGIPLDVSRAVRVLLKGSTRRMDLGVLANGRHFGVTAGVGIDAEMIASTPLELRRKYGVLAYFGTATGALTRMQTFSVRATVDGKVIERDGAAIAMIVNEGSILGGLFQLGPGISSDDGLLDLCVYAAGGLVSGALVAARLAFRDFSSARHMTFARGERITLETIPSLRAQADGEMIGVTPLVTKAAPHAALLLVP